KDIERYKAGLKMASYEHEVKFARLHESRAEVIAEIYSRLTELISNAEIYLQPGSAPQHTHENETGECIQGLRGFFEKNRIYLQEDICHLIDHLLSTIRDFYTERLVLTASRQHTEDDQKLWAAGVIGGIQEDARRGASNSKAARRGIEKDAGS